MPAVYAHRRFGEKVLAACQNDEARTAIETYQDLFNIGLQGPDILFYYDPLRQNPYKAAGDALHDAPAAPFFEAGAAHVNGRPEGQALLSYLLGFLCHFVLDSECHSYILSHPAGGDGIKALSSRFALSSTLLRSCFKAVYGLPLGLFIRQTRLSHAAQLLAEDSSLSIGEVASRVGYANHSRFASAFRRLYGLTPSEYRRSVAG